MEIDTGRLISDIEQAATFIRDPDPDLNSLLRKLKEAHSAGDRKTMITITKEIMDLATYRYLGVVETADRLLQHLSKPQN